MRFDVELIPRHEITNSIDRVALGEVDASVGVQLSERRDVDIYEEMVRNQELALDLGPTGYANSAGWFVANGHLLHDPESCTYQDYWHTFTQVPALEKMLTANEIGAGVNDNGNLVCNPQDGGFCQNDDGKYFGRACNSDGFAIADITRPCRAILAHYPSYDYSVNEQLVNNLDGDGLEFGIVWLGWNATQIITDRASRGEIFLFHHWHPSTILLQGNFTPVYLPTHNPAEWHTVSANTVRGPIASEFLPTMVQKLLNADISDKFDE